MTKSTFSRAGNSTLKRRQRSLAKALRPGVTPLRHLVLAGDLPQPVERAFRELNLDPNDETDWKVLAALLAIHVFDEGKKPGRRRWTTEQMAELLFAFQQRKRNKPRLSDERICGLLAKDKNSPPYFRVGPRGVEGKGQGLIKQLREARHHFRDNALVRTAYPLAFGRN
jgi:hypothetical protein